MLFKDLDSIVFVLFFQGETETKSHLVFLVGLTVYI